MRTKEEMEEAHRQLVETQKAEDEIFCREAASFRGQMIDKMELWSYDSKNGEAWRAAPNDFNLAREYGQRSAFSLLRIGPSCYSSRQQHMANLAKNIFLDQIRIVVGKKVWAKLDYTTDLAAAAEFWEVLVRFAEVGLTSQYVLEQEQNYCARWENERREKLAQQKERKVERRTTAKHGKAVRRQKGRRS